MSFRRNFQPTLVIKNKSMVFAFGSSFSIHGLKGDQRKQPKFQHLPSMAVKWPSNKSPNGGHLETI